jgi:hypothetical protein
MNFVFASLKTNTSCEAILAKNNSINPKKASRKNVMEVDTSRVFPVPYHTAVSSD